MICDIINYTNSSENFKIFNSVILGLVAGLALQPVPKVIEKIITENFFIKLIIIIGFTSKILHPVDNIKLIKITFASVIILLFIEFLRKNENLSN